MSKILVILAIIMILPFAVTGGYSGIAVNLNIRQCSWGDMRLSERLDLYLTAIDNVPVITNETIFGSHDDSYHTSTFAELLAEGRSAGNDYVVDVIIDRIDLEQRKVTLFPRAIFRYRVYAVVSGTVRIIDVDRERLYKMRDLDLEFKTKDRWQVVDDDPTEADLHIPVDRKLKIMKELEDMIAVDLFNDIEQLAQGVGIESEG